MDTHLKPTYNQLTLDAVAAKREQRKKTRPVSGTVIRSRPRTSTTGMLGGVHGIKVGTTHASIKPRRENKSVNYARASQSQTNPNNLSQTTSQNHLQNKVVQMVKPVYVNPKRKEATKRQGSRLPSKANSSLQPQPTEAAKRIGKLRLPQYSV